MPEVQGASKGAIGLAPYADQTEHTGPPEIVVIPDTYRTFLATDARSVMITLFPQHYNMIPNPAFRVDTTGWEINAEPAADAYSWAVLSSDQANAEAAILAGTSSASVEPDPSTSDPYEDGQIIAVVTDFTAYTVTSWRIIDTGAVRDWDPNTDSLFAEDSWVGQSVRVAGAGSMRYRESAGQFVFVGPRGLESDTLFELGRSGSPEWTFSVYVRGSGRARLKMDAYYPADYQNLASGPAYQNLSVSADPFTEPSGDPAILGPDGIVWTLIDPAPTEAPFYESTDNPPAFASVEGPWVDIEDDSRWHRIAITTRARVEENEGRVAFTAAWWIDAQIEWEDADALVSAVMLDPTEYPECAYFDGSMTEEAATDDFIWSGNANDSISEYYFDRLLRARWLWERMGFVVPAGRPFQIFFGAYDRAYIPPEEALEVV